MFHVYCDESRPEAIGSDNLVDKYAVIGGIWVEKKDVRKVKKEVSRLRDFYNVYGEMKWNKVTPSKIDFYKDIINMFFELDTIRFRCIVVDGTKVNLSKFHKSDKELGFYKFYYQLLYHWLNKNDYYSIFVDYTKNKEHNRLSELKSVLNNASLAIVKNLQAVESKQTTLIQIADLLIGAIGYKYNTYNTSEAKNSIIELLEKNIGHGVKPTLRTQNKFNVFEIRL